MNGAGLTTAGPAVETAPSFPPFHHSTPDLGSSLTKPTTTPGSCSTTCVDRSRTPSLDTTTSRPSLPAFDIPSFDFGSDFEPQLTFKTKAADSERTPDESPRPSPRTESKPMAQPRADELSWSKSFIERRPSWLPSSKSTPNVRSLAAREPRLPRKSLAVETERSGSRDAEPKASTLRDRSSSFADFAKKSWISSSRSPSPKRDNEVADHDTRLTAGWGSSESNASSTSPSKPPRRRLLLAPGDGERNRSSDSLSSSTSRALSRASTLITRIKTKPQNVLLTASATTPALAVSAPSPSLIEDVDSSPSAKSSALDPASANNDSCLSPRRLSSQTGASSTTDSSSVTNISASTFSEQSRTTAETMPHPSRDPLWAAFRKLDADFAAFSAKATTAQRMIIVRQALVPFLKTHMYHPSNKDLAGLSAEDIDRRATIMNKWWNGLLELLDGSGSKAAGAAGMSYASSSVTLATPTSTANLQPVAGVDRPALLEAVTHIMMRPEWRLLTGYFRPLVDRSPELVRARAGSNRSVDESSEAFLAESAEHNVRTMFVGNLLAQMTIVVDKLSSRHTPLSLVNFCGKACAYAFFFVPGAAEVLVRLWGLSSDVLRRVAAELGLPRRSKGESEAIVALFPPNMHKLGWTAVKTMTDNLRLATKLPLVMAKIPWHGPWVSKWRGGDTDLLFIFCKYYYILSDEFMPAGLSLMEKARAPAFVLVHAQLLSILDTTIHHRQAAVDAMAMGPPITDPLHGADAMVAALPQLPPSNLLRGMDENRMIILLKDILAEHAVRGVVAEVRETFADAFMAILKAATKKTPAFRHGPVFMLVDFLQEALAVFDGHSGYTDPGVRGRGATGAPPTDHIDWSFWFGVCKTILDSNNTMSEIRILCFIFSTWDVITADPARKGKVCLEWLLTEEVFDRFFNHYSPMVRAYFMRLLCWRICRDEGSANELDAKIFALVSERLRRVWSHYLWLKQQADAHGKLPPSTAPAHPQPGKRFMIIRTEVGTPQTGLLMGFDSSSAFSSAKETDYRTAVSGNEGSPGNRGKNAGYKKKWSILGKVLSFTGGGTTAPVANFHGAGGDLEAARRVTAASRSGGPQPPPKAGGSSSSESDASSTGSSPVFDAAQFVFRFTLSNVPWQPAQAFSGPGLVQAQPRERVLTRPRLPYPAQAKVSAKAAASGGRSESPPPPAPGLPPPERSFSGLQQKGLVSEARNASPLAEESNPTGAVGSGLARPAVSPPSADAESALDGPISPLRGRQPFGASDSDPNRDKEHERQITQPVQPVGAFRDRATYSGRALAEWSLVVNECNSFVDRRRDEGVFGLREVEVPLLGVEGLRRMG